MDASKQVEKTVFHAPFSKRLSCLRQENKSECVPVRDKNK